MSDKDLARVEVLTVEPKAVRLAEEAKGTYLKAISLFMALWDLRNSMTESSSFVDEHDMITNTNGRVDRLKKNWDWNWKEIGKEAVVKYW